MSTFDDFAKGVEGRTFTSSDYCGNPALAAWLDGIFAKAGLTARDVADGVRVTRHELTGNRFVKDADGRRVVDWNEARRELFTIPLD